MCHCERRWVGDGRKLKSLSGARGDAHPALKGVIPALREGRGSVQMCCAFPLSALLESSCELCCSTLVLLVVGMFLPKS